jgi:hypothetical protein
MAGITIPTPFTSPLTIKNPTDFMKGRKFMMRRRATGHYRMMAMARGRPIGIP